MSQQTYLRQQRRHLENDNFDNDHVRNSVRLLDETILQGVDALEMLDSQGRQIDRIGTLEDSINRDVQDSKKIMARINHYFYSSTKIFRPSYWKKNKHQDMSSMKGERYQVSGNQRFGSQSLIKAELERLQEENDFEENDEQYLRRTSDDEFAEQLRPRLAILKDIALLQGSHLDSHNQKLDVINNNIDYTQEDLSKLNTSIRKKF